MPNRPDVYIAPKVKKQYAPRPKTAARGYGAKWQSVSRAFLRKHPFCKYHQDRGDVVAARVVDHIVPHKGDKKLFWDRGNWQPLCYACHNKKSAKE